MNLKGMLKELTVSLLFLVVIVFFLFDPYMLMPMHLMLMSGLIVLFAAFAGLVWKERPRDEREIMQGMRAGRYAYLVGMLLLVVGIIVQSIQQSIDPWLVSTLGAMVLTKLAVRTWENRG